MRIAASAVLALPFVLAACGAKEEPAPAPAVAATPDLGIEYAEMPPVAGYPLTTCVVSGKPLPANPYTIAYQGYQVRFCSKECLKEFAQDPNTYVLKVNPKAILK